MRPGVPDGSTAGVSTADVPPDQRQTPRDGQGTGRRKSYGKTAKRGVVWSFFREGVSELISTPMAIVMARLLTPFDFGVAAAVGLFLTFATRLTHFGFNQALVRVRDLRSEHCSVVFVVSVVLGVAAYAALVGTAEQVSAFLRTPEVADVMPVAAIAFLVVPFGTVPAALMTRNMQFKRTAIADWVSSLGEAAVTIGLALAGWGYWSIAYGRIVGATLSSAAKMILGRWRPTVGFSPAAFHELFSFGSGIFVKRLLDYAAKNLDTLVVGRMLGMSALGFYDKAFTTMNKALIRLNTGGPMVSFRIFALISDDQARFRRAYTKVVLAGSLVSFPILGGLAAAAPELIVVMYGERWASAVAPFQILCAAGALKVLNEYSGSATQAGGRIWGQVGQQAVYAALIVVCVAALSRAGIVGAAWGVLAATIAMTVMMTRLLIRVTGVSALDVVRALIPAMLAALCVGASILAVKTGAIGIAPAVAPWRLLAFEVAAGGLAYGAFLKFAPFRDVRILVRDAAVDMPGPLARLARLLS